jgi:hypothetical protein
LISTVPAMLQALAAELSPAALGEVLNGDFLNFASGVTFVASGVLFILGPILEGPIAGLVPPLSALGVYGPVAGASGAAALAGDGAPFAPGLGSAGLGRGEVLAGLGRAGSVGGLSVPQTWAGAAPATARAATAMPQPTLAGFAEPDVDGLGPGYGGILPASLMAAAAGGGGAAGSGWAATRGAGAAQRGAGAGAAQSSGARTRYEPPPSVIPQAAREAAPQGGTHGQPMSADQRAQAGDGPLGESLRDEINELRKQIADLAVERDVLMRSLALWVKGSTGE